MLDVETDPEILELIEEQTETDTPLKLILWNDEVNTFEHVIACMVRYIKKSSEAAEHIAWTVHTRGKCVLMEGSRKNLVEYYHVLRFNGLTVSLD